MKRRTPLATGLLPIAALLAGCGGQATGSNGMSVTAGDANGTGDLQDSRTPGGGNDSGSANAGPNSQSGKANAARTSR